MIIISVDKASSKLVNSYPNIIHCVLSMEPMCCTNNVKQTHKLIMKLNANKTKPVELNRTSNFCRLSGVPSVKKDLNEISRILGSRRFPNASNRNERNNIIPNTHPSVRKTESRCIGTSLTSEFTMENKGSELNMKSIFNTVFDVVS